LPVSESSIIRAICPHQNYSSSPGPITAIFRIRFSPDAKTAEPEKIKKITRNTASFLYIRISMLKKHEFC
jgi:hypothetical protein